MSESLQAGSLMTAEELAERWRITKGAVYRMARENKIPCVVLGRYYRFTLDAVAEFEKAGGMR